MLSDADQRTGQITTLQDERLAALSEVHTDTLRRLEAVRGVLEKVLIAEADAGPPQSGISSAPLPAAGVAMRAVDATVSSESPDATVAGADAQEPELDGDPPQAADFAEGEYADEYDEDQETGTLTAADLAEEAEYEAGESAVRR